MNIKYSKQSKKFISKHDLKTQERIKSAINKILVGDIRPLKGFDNRYRLRVGTYRIIFTLGENEIYILLADNRGDIY